MSFDPTDTRLLAALQKNALLTSQQLGEILNLSPSQAARRRQRLEARGYIRRCRAVLDPARIGLSVQAFIQVQMARHSPEAARDFTALAQSVPEITDVWILTGEADYMLRVHCRDLSALNHLIQQVLQPHPDVARVQSQIVMEHLKQDEPLPL